MEEELEGNHWKGLERFRGMVLLVFCHLGSEVPSRQIVRGMVLLVFCHLGSEVPSRQIERLVGWTDSVCSYCAITTVILLWFLNPQVASAALAGRRGGQFNIADSTSINLG